MAVVEVLGQFLLPGGRAEPPAGKETGGEGLACLTPMFPMRLLVIERTSCDGFWGKASASLPVAVCRRRWVV